MSCVDPTLAAAPERPHKHLEFLRSRRSGSSQLHREDSRSAVVPLCGRAAESASSRDSTCPHPDASIALRTPSRYAGRRTPPTSKKLPVFMRVCGGPTRHSKGSWATRPTVESVELSTALLRLGTTCIEKRHEARVSQGCRGQSCARRARQSDESSNCLRVDQSPQFLTLSRHA